MRKTALTIPQSRIDEVEDRPQVAEPILDRRAGQNNASFGAELLTVLVCLAAGFLMPAPHQAPRSATLSLRATAGGPGSHSL